MLPPRIRAFRLALQNALVFNDGLGVDIAGRILYGSPFQKNLNGTDFVPNYLRQTKHRYRIFLLGAKPGIAERAAHRLVPSVPKAQSGWLSQRPFRSRSRRPRSPISFAAPMPICCLSPWAIQNRSCSSASTSPRRAVVSAWSRRSVRLPCRRCAARPVLGTKLAA